MLDSSGDLTHALNYDPYGVPLQPNTTNTTLGFTGEQTDPNDLLYLRARYYHPNLGTFTSVDPVLGVGGSTGWNGYLYANANPVNLTDPSGACIGPLTFLLPVCIGALAGFGIGAGLDTVGQVAYIGQHNWDWSLYNPGQALRAGAIGAAGGAVGAGVIGASALGASYLHITAGASSALAYGVGTIAVSGMIGGRAAKLTENALYNRPLDQGLWNLGDIARDALLAVGGTWAFGSAANALTRGNTNYFTAFLPRSFVDLMPASEAARYRGYWNNRLHQSSLVYDPFYTSDGNIGFQNEGDLPGSTGIKVARKLIPQEMIEHTNRWDTEFGLARDRVTGDHWLYSGGKSSVSIPAHMEFVYHTHPSGSPFPSGADLRDLLRRFMSFGQQEAGIIPRGVNTVIRYRYNHTEADWLPIINAWAGGEDWVPFYQTLMNRNK